jgi:hypothetical protein
MITSGEFILNFLLNCLWQIPVIFTVALLGAFALKECPAQLSTHSLDSRALRIA